MSFQSSAATAASEGMLMLQALDLSVVISAVCIVVPHECKSSSSNPEWTAGFNPNPSDHTDRVASKSC
jgi:hypothetical protein